MCIAIVKPAGQWVKKEYLENSFRANPNGAGFAFIDSGEVVIKKGFFTFDAFYAEFVKHIRQSEPALIHFRISTRGKTNEENCHPFAVSAGAMMHNGPQINSKCVGDKDRSDTKEFAEDYVGDFTQAELIKSRKLIEGFAGSEKVAFLFKDGSHLICNEKNGNWTEGCWYSNTSFRGYFSTTGRSLRDTDDFYGTGYGSGYNYGQHYSRATQGSASGTQTGASTVAGQPKNLEQVINRSFGINSPLFPSKWSMNLRNYVPTEVCVDNINMYWHEHFCAFVPYDAVNDLSCDKVYVYEATEKAMAKVTGPNMKDNDDWVICGDCLKTEHDLRMFLREAELVKKLAIAAAPAPAPATTPPTTTAASPAPAATPAPAQQNPQLPAVTTSAADASAAKTETVH